MDKQKPVIILVCLWYWWKMCEM